MSRIERLKHVTGRLLKTIFGLTLWIGICSLIIGLFLKSTDIDLHSINPFEIGIVLTFIYYGVVHMIDKCWDYAE